MINTEVVMDEAETGIPALGKELCDCIDEVNHQRMIGVFRYMNKVFQECKTRCPDHPNIQAAEIYMNMMHDITYVRKIK
jgi:hypothetical protein